MAYNDRKKFYRKIEKVRQRPLICYVTSSRIQAPGQMAPDVIPELAKQLNLIPKDITAIDVIIVSNGGDPTVSWRFISLLRERFERVGVMLPYAAYSAATLLALGADEIIMHPYANLGPVDPQLQLRRQGQQEAPIDFEFGSEDLRHYFDFVRNDVGISDQEQLEKSFELVCKDVGAIPIGIAKRSSHLALSMGEKLLSLHMTDTNKAKAIAEALNTSFYHHGYPLGRREAIDIGLPIVSPGGDIETLMWQVWEDIEEEMECKKPFNPIEIVFQNADAASKIGPVPQVQLPNNLPPQVLQQVLQQILQNISVISIDPIDYEVFQATLESLRGRSEFRTSGKINAVRKADLSISVSKIQLSQGWSYIK